MVERCFLILQKNIDILNNQVSPEDAPEHPEGTPECPECVPTKFCSPLPPLSPQALVGARFTAYDDPKLVFCGQTGAQLGQKRHPIWTHVHGMATRREMSRFGEQVPFRPNIFMCLCTRCHWETRNFRPKTAILADWHPLLSTWPVGAHCKKTFMCLTIWPPAATTLRFIGFVGGWWTWTQWGLTMAKYAEEKGSSRGLEAFLPATCEPIS